MESLKKAKMLFSIVGSLLITLFLHIDVASGSSACRPRDYGNGSPVCVCDQEYCDFVQPIEPIGDRDVVVYTSDKSGRRLERTVTRFVSIDKEKAGSNDDVSENLITLNLNASNRKQTIAGFGGAFTDAAGINIASLPENARDKLLRSYFGKDGIEYTIGRVPISSTDFSTRKYSYDDVDNDFDLKHFALAEEDLQYKIPFILAAHNLTARPIRLFASSWSAPAWMKNSGTMEGNGTLLGTPSPNDKYYTSWANYYVKFFEEYSKHNITFWALTGQNEPSTGYIYNYGWQTQGFTPEMQRDFIKYNLGPALNKSAFWNVSIMIVDDNRLLLPSWPRKVLADEEVRKYVSHIAVHYYSDEYTPAFTLDNTHNELPDFEILATEACVGTMGGTHAYEQHVMLGSWERGEQYCHDIIEDLNHWVVGWVDWNIALNPDGGPNWAKNFVDSPIIVNATSGEFYKQPMYYALGHFSKFLPPGSFRIGVVTTSSHMAANSKMEMTAFLNADGYKTMVMMNRQDKEKVISIKEEGRNEMVKLSLSPRSIVTVLWK